MSYEPPLYIKPDWEYCKDAIDEYNKRILEEIIEERKQHNADPDSKMLRYNVGKPQYSYVDLQCLEGCAQVLTYGAEKYTRNNWRKGAPLTHIIDSLLRHVAALQRGEMIDPESGVSHIGHIQANAMFLGNQNNINDLEDN